MSVQLSKEFAIKYDGAIIARCLDFSFEINKSTIDLTTLDSGSWRELLADSKEWRISFNALIAKDGTNDYEAMLDDIKNNDTPITVIIGKRTTAVGDKFEEGDAIITALSFSASVGDRATYSGTLEGTGELVTQTVEA